MDANEVHQEWVDRTGEFSPRYYAYYGPNETSALIRETLDSILDTDASVLELGCSSGRHLAHLRDHGFENVSGIEINSDAFDVMQETYPDLWSEGTFFCDSIEATVPAFGDGSYDAVFTVQTLQHVHPDHAWVFEEVARITADVLVTVENEGGDTEVDSTADPSVSYVNDALPLYFRDWNRVFTDLGFVQIDSRTIDRDTLRVFRVR